jgi:hypothetical protein
MDRDTYLKPARKLSETLVGSISKEDAEIYQRAVKTMREEWSTVKAL